MAPLAGLAFSVTVPPLHIAPLFVGTAVGMLFTVTVVVYVVPALQPEPELLIVNE